MLIVYIRLHFICQAFCIRDPLQGILPVIDLVSIGILSRICILKHAFLLQPLHIRPDLIIAGIDIVTAVVTRIEGIITDGIDTLCHNGQFFIRIISLRFYMQNRCIIKHISDLFHQFIGKSKHNGHSKRQTDHKKNAAHQISYDGSHGELIPAFEIKDLPNDGNDGKPECHGNTDQHHAHISICDGLVPEEYIEKFHFLTGILDFRNTGKNLEYPI